MTKELTGAVWRKSSYSNAERNCVEVADLPNGIRAVRDSKNPERSALLFSPTEWQAFVAEAARM